MGKGTSVNLILNIPLADAKSEDIQKTTDGMALAGKRILIAEDQPMNVLIVQKILAKWGIETEVAENGRRAVELYQESPLRYYDAILMDIRMPIMDGMEACRVIRATERADKNLPILAMTANAFADDRRASMEAGMNAHLAKPINPEEVYSTLCALVK